MGKETSSQDSDIQAHKNQACNTKQADFHGAAILNRDGSETPITEQMVQDACKQLDTKKPGANKPG